MLIPKLFTCLKNYNKEMFLNDLISGIIVAIIALPLSIALGIASGVSPKTGLITAIVGGFFVSMLGGSRVQIGGPTGAFVVIVLNILNKYGLEGLIAATFMAGVILILLGLFKLGNMVKFIPYPITTGFTSGIAIIIFSTQIKDFLGLNIEKVPSEFLSKWTCYINNLSSINISAAIIGILTIGIIILWPKINKKIPGAFIAIICTTLIALLMKLDLATIETQFGEISNTLPMPSLPNLSFNMVNELLMSAVVIAVLGSVESLLSAVVADGMIGGNHRSNMELIGQGVANIFSSLFGGIPVTGAIARTAANVKNGGRTPIAGIVHSITLLLMMLVLMPYVKYIPMASLAGILIVVSYNMGEWEEFKELSKCPKSDALVFVITFALTIIFDLVVAIEVGMVLSAFLFMKRMSDVTKCTYITGNESKINDEIELLSEKNIPSEIDIYEINGPFFFGAADKFIKTIKSIENHPKVLILKMSHVPVIDATGYSALNRLYDICKHNGTRIIIMELQNEPYVTLEKYGFISKIGPESVCKDLDYALTAAKDMMKCEIVTSVS